MPRPLTLYDELDPIAVWVTIAELEHPESDTRLVTLRTKMVGHRSVTASWYVSRYADEMCILRAASECMADVSRSLKPIGRQDLVDLLSRALAKWVEPF